MNIQKAMVLARKQNRAIRGRKWPAGSYMYHGMDNLMRHPDGREVTWSVAALMSTDYVITEEAEYHGPLTANAAAHSRAAQG